MKLSKYKVGDKVKIRSLAWYYQNKDKFGCIDYFIPEMSKYCGQEATIVGSYFKMYLIDIDNHFWYWTEEMFEEV